MVPEHFCTFKLDPETGQNLYLFLYKDVENIEELRTKLINKQLECCLIKAIMIHDPFQVVIAANKALTSQKYGSITTRTLFTEILFNLSVSNNITQSLKTFGAGPEDFNLLVAIYADDSATLAHITDQIRGTNCPMSELPEMSDNELIMKTYKIRSTELTMSNLLDSIVSRIATKDTVSL